MSDDRRARETAAAVAEYRDVVRRDLPAGPTVAALRDTLALCRAERIPVALVLCPEATTFRAIYPSHVEPKLAGFLAGLTAEFGCPVADARVGGGRPVHRRTPLAPLRGRDLHRPARGGSGSAVPARANSAGGAVKIAFKRTLRDELRRGVRPAGRLRGGVRRAAPQAAADERSIGYEGSLWSR